MTARRRVALAALAALLCVVQLCVVPVRAGASVPSGVSVTPSSVPAFSGDAPDPDVVLVGSTYLAFTTGTSLAGYLQVLCDPVATVGAPTTGWVPCSGFPYGASALPDPPEWEARGTQNAPGVYEWEGRWIMFYTAALAGSADDTGHNCLSVATTTDLGPTEPAFVDTSTGPLLCDTALGGAIDPMPVVDPVTGQPYLVWKSNSGIAGRPAQLWSQALGRDGMTPVGQPALLQTQDTATHPFETTIENPQLLATGGRWYLLFSTGIWDSASYAETAVSCAGPSGPCDEPSAGPFLSSSRGVSGPGGGMLFTGASGAWYLAYAAWGATCTSYRCGGARRLFVAPASVEPFALSPPVTGIAATRDGGGYWLTDAAGGVSPHGTAAPHGSMLGLALDAPVSHIVPTADGGGYWLVAADGGIFAFGDAAFYGSMGGKQLNAPVVDLAPTPDGRGYWLVASDGGVFAFGDARFQGSTGAERLRAPMVGMAADPATGGYWLVASDGGVFAFGAPFLGSAGGRVLARPVNGMAVADGQGYWLVASDGGVFAFGDAAFRGSTGGLRLAAPVVGMAGDPATDGYWLVGADGGVFAFDAPFLGAR